MNDSSNSTFSNPHNSVINRFYDSLTTNTDTNNNQPTLSNKLTRFSDNNTPFENTSHFLSSTQEVTSQQFQSGIVAEIFLLRQLTQ